MRSTFLMPILAIGGLAAGATSAPAQCGGGGSYRGGGYGGPDGGCGTMMPATQATAPSMPGMVMNGHAAPVAAPMAPTAAATVAPTASQYHCPMHPSVVSGVPARCPFCGMALVRK